MSRRGAHVLYLGSGEHPAALRVLGPNEITPGTEGNVRLRLDSPYPMLPGDRFVLRESGRSETIGGGEVLDIDPVTKASRAVPDRSVDRVIAERGWIEVDRLDQYPIAWLEEIGWKFKLRQLVRHSSRNRRGCSKFLCL